MCFYKQKLQAALDPTGLRLKPQLQSFSMLFTNKMQLVDFQIGLIRHLSQHSNSYSH